MKFLIDNNLSYKLAGSLQADRIEAVHIKSELSVFAMDREIWEHACEHDLVILTKDSDFDELSQLY